LSVAERSDRKRPRVLVLGPRFAAVAAEAVPDATFEVLKSEEIDQLAARHDGFDLVLIGADTVDPGKLTEAIEALGQKLHAPGVLLLGARLPANAVRALFKLKRSDVLETPFTAGDLGRSAEVLLKAQPQVATGPQTSHCWAITGAVGGAGATTLAIELAVGLADRKSNERVALVDLNLADGQACAYLGSAANMNLGEASLTPERIDAALLDAFAVRVDDCLDLYASPRDPRAFEHAAAPAVLRLLEVTCEVYDWVIVDVPRLRQPWTADVLAGSDEVMVVSELTVPALLAARALAQEIEAELPEARSAHIVVNRLASRVFGPAPSLADAEKALGRKVLGGITSDWEAAACSVNLGGPIRHHRPRSKIVKDVTSLIGKLTAEARRGAAAGLRIA
jgi:pilus assembly protein CpaE